MEKERGIGMFKRLHNHVKAWNIWRKKYHDRSWFFKILVLLGLTTTAPFELLKLKDASEAATETMLNFLNAIRNYGNDTEDRNV